MALWSPVLALLGVSIVGAANGQDSASSYLPPSSPDYDDLITEIIEVEMPDGVTLSANVIRPDAPGERFPVLFRMEPYRHDVERRYLRSAYLARRGYVVTYFHVRGTGRSEGFVPDREYSLQEIQDGVDIIDWLSRQVWSNGNVGMYGHSWSTINTYFVAARKPSALKAVWLGDCTDDIYHEDVHYQYGMLKNYASGYNLWIDVNTAQAAHPDYILDDDYFADRFNQPPWSLIYLKNQGDGEFWYRHNRLDVNPMAMTVPAYGVSGWNAPYRSSIPRLLEHAAGPTRAVIGPWSHSLSRHTEWALQPGPHPEWRFDMVRWWDYWLKDRDTGIMDDPPVVVFMRHSNEALPWEEGDDPADYQLPGEWRADTWPPQGLEEQTYYLHPDNALSRRRPTAPGVHELEYKVVDGEALTYETDPLGEEVTILGHPKARLRASATAKLAHWFVRVLDVAPDGTTTQVSNGGINGAFRYSSIQPAYLTPGEEYDLDVKLEVAGWIFRPGHRVRVEITNALRPAWPTPYLMTTSLYLGEGDLGAAGRPASPPEEPFVTHITLPVVPRTSALPLPEFVDTPRSPDEHMEGIAPRPFSPPGAGGGGPEPVYNDADESVTITNADGDVTFYLSNVRPDSVVVRGFQRFRSGVTAEHPTPQSDDRRIAWEGTTEIHSDSLNFYYRHERILVVDDEVIRSRVWRETIPRYFH